MEQNKKDKQSPFDLTHKECLDFYYNILKFKFNYWFDNNILPHYVTGNAQGITKNEILKIYEKYNSDVMNSVHPAIFGSLLKNYFHSMEAITLNNKEYFYSRLIDYEKKYLQDTNISRGFDYESFVREQRM